MENWYWILAAAVILGEASIFLFFGENSYIAVHDNLDLFMGHFQAMKKWGVFFGHQVQVPILGGITRDYLSSEFSLYNILFWLLPPFAAYMCGYFLKILIALFCVYALARDIYGRLPGQKENWKRYRAAAVCCGLIYGLLPLFPAYGLAFASIPLVVLLLRRIYRGESRWDYLFLFLYPLLSYFSYFGFFILAYLAAAILIVWVRDSRKERKNAFPARLFAALFILAAGYVLFEYRLFGEMLFSDTVTMRSTMKEDNFTAGQILTAVWEVFTQAIFHAQPSHTRFVLPLCAVFFVCRAAGYLKRKEGRKFFTDPFVLVIGFIAGNCVIYGCYYWKGFRELFETLVPPLKGFQFSRTVFFNPFLWYAALFLLVKTLYDKGKRVFRYLGNLILAAALSVVILTPAVYNDFYYTCYYNAYRILKHTEVENLNYREFFSEELFEQILEDIGYNGEYSAAYGLHPAVLSYNGIATLDGYLGFYPQEYKEKFGAMIAPATGRVEEWDIYFNEWGARAYLFSGSGENTWNPVRTMTVSDDRLYIDGDMFRQLGGKYLFSRIAVGNAQELGFTLRGVYCSKDSPYTIYVYET